MKPAQRSARAAAAAAAPTGAQRGAIRWLRRWRATRIRRIVWDIGSGVLVLGMLALVLALFFSDEVVGPSMLPGLHSGDRVLINPLAYKFGSPQRGDVVVVLPPLGPRNPAVKRIIGLPGDQLEIRSPALGQPPAVYLRPGGKGPWQRLREPYLQSAGPAYLGCCTSAGLATEHPMPFTVPAGEYFVLGDNRNVSYDSRDYGPVPLAAIQGKVIWIVLPLGRFGPVDERPSLTPA